FSQFLAHFISLEIPMHYSIAANRATRDGRAVKGVRRTACSLQHAIDELVDARYVGNRKFQMRPSSDARVDEFQVRSAMSIDIDLIATSGSGLARVASLRVTGVNDHRWLDRQHRRGVHMSQRPVIKSSRGQFGDGCRRVIRVPAL